MRDLKALLQQSEREHAERLQKIRSELKSLPPGRLEALQMKNRTYYYQRGQSKRRGITRIPELVRKLARKRYLMEERKIIQNNLAQIKKTLSVCESYSLDAILQRIPLRVRQLPRQYFYKKRVTHDYDKNTSHPEHLLYVTNGGEVVRSKSERSIGDMLEEYGLDYDYDRRVEGYFYYADFTIHCRDGSIIIWEHFGLMDTYEDYHKKALIRMEDYRKNVPAAEIGIKHSPTCSSYHKKTPADFRRGRSSIYIYMSFYASVFFVSSAGASALGASAAGASVLGAAGFLAGAFFLRKLRIAPVGHSFAHIPQFLHLS